MNLITIEKVNNLKKPKMTRMAIIYRRICKQDTRILYRLCRNLKLNNGFNYYYTQYEISEKVCFLERIVFSRVNKMQIQFIKTLALEESSFNQFVHIPHIF